MHVDGATPGTMPIETPRVIEQRDCLVRERVFDFVADCHSLLRPSLSQGDPVCAESILRKHWLTMTEIAIFCGAATGIVRLLG
jgi:hypothetical protein